MTADSILVVEDTAPLRDVLCTVLEREGFVPCPAASAEDALRILGEGSFACILSDFKLPGMNGLELLRAVREHTPQVPFVIMTAFGSIDIAVQAMKDGANDFIAKPFEPAALAPMLRQVIRHRRILDRNAFNKQGSRPIITSSPILEHILGQARQVAKVDTSVLILGESGTGKELMARYIHEHSPRRDKPFLAVNCAALPPELLESEFFGHEAGAFTGATQSRSGVFEVAAEGTVFLDEVGDMPPLLQVKLLRALQEHEIRRVGSTKHLSVNPRIIAATNRPIEEALLNGSLREDFYYRVAVVAFTLPPLRERREDILPIAQLFANKFCEATGRETLSFDLLASDMLQAYPWPGNVRELENVVERALISASTIVRPEHLGIHVPLDVAALEEASRTLPQIAQEAVRRAESEAILKTLVFTNGNKSRAAQLLGVSYKTLLNKVKEYQLGVVDAGDEALDAVES